jgi:hypothetical protein
LSLFEKDSFGYHRFQKFLKTYTIANELKCDVNYTEDKYFSNLVFVYDKFLPDKEPIVYSSINKALKALLISHGTLMNCIANQFILRDSLILSFEPLRPEDFQGFTQPVVDNQLWKNVIVFNEDNEPVFEFKSAREMARHFEIDGKVARAAIAKGAYQNFILVVKAVSYRQEILVFNSETLELITELKSVTAAMRYAKVNFYTMKDLLETNKPLNGKIYRYNKTILTK